jgi:hypothetical protein
MSFNARKEWKFGCRCFVQEGVNIDNSSNLYGITIIFPA